MDLTDDDAIELGLHFNSNMHHIFKYSDGKTAPSINKAFRFTINSENSITIHCNESETDLSKESNHQ